VSPGRQSGTGLDLVAAHDPGHAMFAAGFARFTQITEDARSAVHTATDRIRITNEPKQPLILDRAIR